MGTWDNLPFGKMLLYSKASGEIRCLTVLFTQQVVALSDFGGASLGELTHKVVQKVGTNMLWSTFSMKGKKGKNALDEMPLCKLLTSEFHDFKGLL